MAVIAICGHCGIEFREGEKALWCARISCEQTTQRGPTLFQRKKFDIETYDDREIRDRKRQRYGR